MADVLPVQAHSKLLGFVRRPVVALAIGACAVASVFVFLTMNDGPKVSSSKVPIPFIPGENHQGPGGGSNLAGSVTYIRTLASGVEFYEMDFIGDSSQQAPADKVYLIKVPSGVAPIAFERAILDSNGGSTRPYYGYIYTTPNATQEIANQTASGFNVRFPGIFFASAAAMAAHGGDLNAFASLNGIVFKTAGAYAVNHNNVLLDGPQLIAFVPVDQNLTIDIAEVCGNTWKGDDEECDDGDTDNGDGCSSVCLVEAGFTCDEDSPSVCTADAVCGDGFRAQGEACDDGNTTASDGCSATCTTEAGYVCDTSSPNICLQTCGNGDVQNGEVCDDGNITAGDGCSATCQEENGFTCTGDPSVCDPDAGAPVCGNSLREGDLCGNAFVDNDEECDYAIECEFTVDGEDCTCHDDCTICDGNEDCSFTAPSYNGETCDDGDTTNGDGCSSTCDVEDGFTCDTASPNVCSVIVICGNGTIEGNEVCDDNDADSGDGCSATCQVEAGFTCDGDEPTVCTPDPECGDGFKTQGEDCDDGNVATGDGCNATCDVEAGFVCDNSTPNICLQTCGDGNLDAGEDCDDGNVTVGDGCNSICDVESGWTCDQSEPSVCDPDPVAPVCGNQIREGDLCGNQFVDNDEECDYAIDCAGVADGQPCDCHEDCTLCDGAEDCTFNAPAYNGETCDDGDTDAGDGCNATCDVEAGYSCDTATPNVCSLTQVCGDGNIEGSEACDDGDTDPGDGCDASCAIENGYFCSGEPSVCVDPTCGNGVRELGEQCDDGDTTAGDGCNATCQEEAGWSCDMGSPNTCSLDCEDMDSANIVVASHVVQFGNGIINDRCDDNPAAGFLIYEQTCNATTLLREEVLHFCPVGTHCVEDVNGKAACVTAGAPPPSGGELDCSEDDGGFVIQTAGTATNGSTSDPDACVGPSTIDETYCARQDGTVRSISLSCGAGQVCLNGACVAE